MLKKSKDELAINTIIKALDDDYEYLRRQAIGALKNAAKAKPETVKEKLLAMAKNDSDSKVRGDAIAALARYFENDKAVTDICVSGMEEQSYYVIGESLLALSKNNGSLAMKYASAFEKEKNGNIVSAITTVYEEHGTEKQLDYFITKNEEISGFEKYGFAMSTTRYLKNQDHETVKKGSAILKETALNEKTWWIRMAAINGISDLEAMYANRIHIAEQEIKEAESGSENEQKLRTNIDKDKNVQQHLIEILNEIKAKEEHPRLKAMLGIKD